MKSERSINGCQILIGSEMIKKYPFSTIEIVLNSSNVMGIEINSEASRIRIDGIEVTDKLAFKKMMEVLFVIADTRDLRNVYFADALDNKALDLFLDYGFREEYVEPYHHYLSLSIMNKEG